ncbi:ABC transporter ATP-binding protein [Parasphingopyxis lamellibrachiae]|uniref:Iron complex transport system ATP-binding protein n=1 Tax=Parasphingopyxis lamellibrachiae TaxID=680125 RepID=A0A3D9FDE5_9SPHN|nr:ABC transporter ATP-binding protein [Parasphingopyxis lamellibrachiae]RED15592.1 iron complex transport system ATP-binding protein [Parasphingopyxis lamellibrachiae]
MTSRLTAHALSISGRLTPCDLTFSAGSVTMLVGPNGAGKTSLLHALAGLPESCGKVLVDGDDIHALAPVRRVRHVAFLGASRDVRWPLSVRDFIALGLPDQSQPGHIEEVLDSLEAGELAGRRLDHLSTGERSRVMIARALVSRSSVLLLDEPIANLDPKWQLTILARLRSEADRGTAVILSIHDLDLARQHGDRVIVIDKGEIVADSTPSQALSEAVIAEIFGVSRSGGRWVRA